MRVRANLGGGSSGHFASGTVQITESWSAEIIPTDNGVAFKPKTVVYCIWTSSGGYTFAGIGISDKTSGQHDFEYAYQNTASWAQNSMQTVDFTTDGFKLKAVNSAWANKYAYWFALG